jgi:hypothetical protein
LGVAMPRIMADVDISLANVLKLLSKSSSLDNLVKTASCILQCSLACLRYDEVELTESWHIQLEQNIHTLT